MPKGRSMGSHVHMPMDKVLSPISRTNASVCTVLKDGLTESQVQCVCTQESPSTHSEAGGLSLYRPWATDS